MGSQVLPAVGHIIQALHNKNSDRARGVGIQISGDKVKQYEITVDETMRYNLNLNNNLTQHELGVLPNSTFSRKIAKQMPCSL